MKDILNIRNEDSEKVQVEQMSKELAPLNQQLGTIARSSDLIMLGEGNHFFQDTKLYSKQIFMSALLSINRNPIVFLEARNEANLMKHYDYAVEYCREHRIPFYPVDTDNKPKVGDPGLYPERDIAIANNINIVMENNPGFVGIFIGGSNHCNKNGILITDSSRHGKNYDYPSAASLLKKHLRIGSVALHFMHTREMLAKRIDASDELLSLPGKYAEIFISQRFSSSGELHPVRHLIRNESFDLIAFLPTIERRIINILGGDPKRITYNDDEKTQ